MKVPSPWFWLRYHGALISDYVITPLAKSVDGIIEYWNTNTPAVKWAIYFAAALNILLLFMVAAS